MQGTWHYLLASNRLVRLFVHFFALRQDNDPEKLKPGGLNQCLDSTKLVLAIHTLELESKTKNSSRIMV